MSHSTLHEGAIDGLADFERVNHAVHKDLAGAFLLVDGFDDHHEVVRLDDVAAAL